MLSHMHIHHCSTYSKDLIIPCIILFLSNTKQSFNIYTPSYQSHYNYHYRHHHCNSLLLFPSPSLSNMFSSCKSCLSHPPKWVRALLQPLKALNKVKRGNRRKPKRLFSSFDWITSSFAALEVSNQLKQVFKLIDANGDGKISPLELGEVLLCLGHEKLTAAKEAEGMVRELDFNGDGYIDLDEFMEVVAPEGEVGSSNKEDDLMDAFLVFDSDRDGYISANELQRVFVSLGFDKCSLDECFLMIRGVDKDGDGHVDFEEFRSMMIGCTSCEDSIHPN